MKLKFESEDELQNKILRLQTASTQRGDNYCSAFFFVRVDLCVKDLVFSELKKISTFLNFLDGNKSGLKLRGENFESFPMTGRTSYTHTRKGSGKKFDGRAVLFFSETMILFSVPF